MIMHHKVQKFYSITGSPGWSWKKGRKTVVVWWYCQTSSVTQMLHELSSLIWPYLCRKGTLNSN